ncbi:hypothetical protein D3C76_1739420 [compost metagenome]
MVGLIDSGFQADLSLTQLLLDHAPLLNFAGQRLIEPLAVALGGLQVFNQGLVLKTFE